VLRSAKNNIDVNAFSELDQIFDRNLNEFLEAQPHFVGFNRDQLMDWEIVRSISALSFRDRNFVLPQWCWWPFCRINLPKGVVEQPVTPNGIASLIGVPKQN
jgi:hypothetical protein